MAAYNQAFAAVAEKLKINEFSEHQKAAIRTVIQDKRDVFVNLPTGCGKSLVFQALPFIFDCVSSQQGHIVVVVSPLLNLISDQLVILRKLGISATSISDLENEEERREVERGSFKIVYGTPEAWLLSDRWRNMLNNSTYSSKLCAVAIDEAHVIKHWGSSTNNTLAAFRDCYSRLHEFRSLAPSVNVIALTATATKATRDIIFEVLMMDNPHVIFESPNKENVAYSVQYMPKDADLEHCFDWLVEELRAKKEHCDRTIVYCQTIKQCSVLYATLRGMLGRDMYIDSGDPTKVLLEMLHSCTPMSNKEHILTSFANEQGTIRVLIATIAFGMGVNCKGVTRVIHFGPSKNIESYTQETGRAGRDGTQSIAVLLYNGVMLSHVEANMKSYVKSNHCRRHTLLKHFEDDSSNSSKELHLCCDHCASECQCGVPDCGKLTSYPTEGTEDKPASKVRSRDVTQQHRDCVQKKLTIYHKIILKKLLNTAANTDLKTLTGIPFLLGFSETQITQVLHNLEHLFSLNDICNFVEIWDMKHAHEILRILSDEFQDVQHCFDNDDFEMDDMFLEDWEDILEDNELFDLAIDNLSLSSLEDSFTEQESMELNASDVGIPATVLETLERVHLVND